MAGNNVFDKRVKRRAFFKVTEFIEALTTQGFLQHGLIGGLLASIGCGIIGSFVVVKRISYVAGGVAHAALGGMGVSFFFGAAPVWGALIASALAAIIIGVVTLSGKERQDTIISAIWAVGMAIGVIFISKTPGYGADLMSYLFGNILMITKADLFFMALLDVVILLVTLTFYHRLVAVSFDEEFARLRGVKVEALTITLYVLVALTVTLLIKVVGLILVIALLTLPAATAGRYVTSLFQMMVTAILLGAVYVVSGMAISYQPDFPPGATIILVAGTVYLISIILTGKRQR